MYISLSRSPKQGTKATGTQGITACGTIRKKKHYQGANSEEELSGGQQTAIDIAAKCLQTKAGWKARNQKGIPQSRSARKKNC